MYSHANIASTLKILGRFSHFYPAFHCPLTILLFALAPCPLHLPLSITTILYVLCVLSCLALPCLLFILPVLGSMALLHVRAFLVAMQQLARFGILSTSTELYSLSLALLAGMHHLIHPFIHPSYPLSPPTQPILPIPSLHPFFSPPNQLTFSKPSLTPFVNPSCQASTSWRVYGN